MPDMSILLSETGDFTGSLVSFGDVFAEIHMVINIIFMTSGLALVCKFKCENIIVAASVQSFGCIFPVANTVKGQKMQIVNPCYNACIVLDAKVIV